MSDIDPNKLKVVELRTELAARGLDTKGNKAVLVKRLEDALNLEYGNNTVTKDNETAEDDDDQDQNISTFDSNQESQEEDSLSKKDADQSQPEDQIKEEYEEEPQEFTEAGAMKSIKQEPFDSDVKEERYDYGGQTVKEEPKTLEVKQEPVEHVEHQRGEKRGRSPSWDRKRNLSGSPSRDRKSSDSRNVAAQPVDDFEDSSVTLDLYNSDLNLVINKERHGAAPFTSDGFALMWSGARSSYGFLYGKVCFEVKVMEHLDVSHLPDDEPNPHVVRVGVSVDETSMQLGEEPLSWGYGGTAKASTNCQFKNYGTPFAEGDTVGCFVNLDKDPVELAYTKNGNPQGVAYYIPRQQLGERALFPHVLTKNCSFEVNFGQKTTPFYPIPKLYEDYIFIGCTSLNDRQRGPKEPARREDCEMIMMCGLPASGKSTWAAEYCKLHPDKKYNVLGTNNIIDKMKVMGLPRKRNYAGRWDVLIDKSTKCLNKMMELGSKKKRNFILDQTNVYASAQRRKMRPFEGFKRRAVVLVPTDEEFRRRTAKREKEEGKDVPESAVLEMKANFIPPEAGNLFESVDWVELPEEDGRPLIEQYRREGRAALPPPEKRFRPNDRGGSSQRGGRFGPPLQNRDRDRDNSRGRMDDRRYNSGGRGGNYGNNNRGGMGYGNYRDRGSDRGGFNRNTRGMDHRGGSSNRGGPNRNGPPSRGGSGNQGRGGYGGYGRENYSREGYGRDNSSGYGRDNSYNRDNSGYGRDNSYSRDNSGYGRDNSYSRDSSSSSGYGRDSSGYSRDNNRDRGDRSYQGGGQAPKQEPKSSPSPAYGQSGYSSGYGSSQSYGSNQNYGSNYGQSYGQSYNSSQGYGSQQQSYSQSAQPSTTTTTATQQQQWKQPSSSAAYAQSYGSSYSQPAYGSSQSQTQTQSSSYTPQTAAATTTTTQQQPQQPQSYYQQYYNQQWSQWNQQQAAAGQQQATATQQQPYYSQYYNSSNSYYPSGTGTSGTAASGVAATTAAAYGSYSQSSSQQK